ncbi:hypothetical protein Bequi_13500 [Brachybacterium sp. JHP9]|uniref:Uncharacterized protein n=1 Tax=Brachybacterium equifaecis TaxID=2910770 RepID=A0ABT0R371_9MICO|nr:hypothetical protein [Brachybacterium equifaecis]MCL6424380.1 hypothetical protein [Brachybacterium equifaecis]
MSEPTTTTRTAAAGTSLVMGKPFGAADLGEVLPSPEDPIGMLPPEIPAAAARASQLLDRIHGPGPHLEQLADGEHAELIAHLSRLAEAITRLEREEAGDIAAHEDDWPFDVETRAEQLDAYEHRGTTPRGGDDPSTIDYTSLASHALDDLRAASQAWTAYAQAVSASRPRATTGAAA